MYDYFRQAIISKMVINEIPNGAVVAVVDDDDGGGGGVLFTFFHCI